MLFYQSLTCSFITVIIVKSLSILAASSDLIDAQINFYVEGNGFHRTVHYEIDTGKFLKNDCHVALYLELSSSLFINIDELAESQRLGKSTACSEGETDVELFAEDAKPQRITVCSSLSPSASTNLSIPLHQRYQRAKYDESYVTVILPNPKLLLGCKNRIKEYRVSKIDLCHSCVGFSIKWREIPYKMKTEQYKWIIPVGDLSNRNYVIHITLFTSCIGTIYILRSLCQRKMINRPKMD